MALEPTNIVQETPEIVSPQRAASSWWPVLDFAALLGWFAVAAVTLRYHEKWADEAQAWLIARDLPLHTLWLKELRYEGSPGLWHTILWIAQHVFHAPYAALGPIGLACATAGVAFVLWKSPFPRPLRYMLVFSYFMLYQYAVIARPYTLLPLLAFAAAYFFRDREHPERITAVLVLLSLLTVHGVLIAAGIGLAYLIDAARNWSKLDPNLRRRYLLCVGAMTLTFLFLFFVLKPTPDVEEFVVKKNPAQFHLHEHSAFSRLTSTLSGAFLDFALPSAIFLFLAGLWCYLRRTFLAFVLPIGLLTILYVKIHGVSHHHGTLFIAAMAALWIAWPTTQEQHAFTLQQRRALQSVIALLVCLFALNIWDAAVSIRYEYLYPYSGAEDAARYLKPAVDQKQRIFGYSYGMAGVQAYFDHNITANIPTTYYHHGTPLYGRDIDPAELDAASPDYLVFLSGKPDADLVHIDPVLKRHGYEMVHFSDGYLFFKRSLMDRQCYIIYKRTY